MIRTMPAGIMVSVLGLLLAALPAASEPGRPADHPRGPAREGAMAAVAAVQEAGGLSPFYRAGGALYVSVDAAGGNGTGHAVTVRKPSATARVVKAFLLAASNEHVRIRPRDITLDGAAIEIMAARYNDLPDRPRYFHSILSDVTDVVAPKVDAAAAGPVRFTLAERRAVRRFIDGEILAVVFRDPEQIERRSVALYFGAVKVGGDRFRIGLNQRLDPERVGVEARLGFGISFSYQKGGTGQATEISINGTPLTASAGGGDDGGEDDGLLITVGGLGDRPGNPRRPNAAPSGPRSDDELYNILPFVRQPTRSIDVEAVNPSSDDNVFFAWSEVTTSLDPSDDNDGDGLPDAWERYGYDADRDGTIDVNLPKLGAKAGRKDLFIAYAWMAAGPGETQSHKPSAAVLKAVTDAFADAPVANPDGSTGITVHWRDLGQVAHEADLDDPWADFDRLLAGRLTTAERRVYRRMLNAHAHSGGTEAGLSRGIPHSDFMETLGSFASNPGTLKERAGTIMHELGHTLGLRNGGTDNVNRKPNHLSVMNIDHQFEWVPHSGGEKLDYQRFALASLDENDLDEAAGLDRIGGDGPLMPYGVRWWNGTIVPNLKATRADVNVNWDNSFLDTDPSVAVDINNDGSLTVLRGGPNEWEMLVFDGGSIGPPTGAGPSSLLSGPADLADPTAGDSRRKAQGRR